MKAEPRGAGHDQGRCGSGAAASHLAVCDHVDFGIWLRLQTRYGLCAWHAMLASISAHGIVKILAVGQGRDTVLPQRDNWWY